MRTLVWMEDAASEHGVVQAACRGRRPDDRLDLRRFLGSAQAA